MSKKPSVFKGQQSVKFIYTIAASGLTPKGMYNLGINVAGEGYKTESKTQIVEVERVQHLEILTLNVPEYVKEGDTLTTEFVIQNSGNTTERVILKTLHGKIELPKLDTLTGNLKKLIPLKHRKKVGAKNKMKAAMVRKKPAPNKSFTV